MKRFKEILVVAPRDVDMRKPLRAAAQLATTNGARLTIFDSLTPIRFGRRAVLGDFQPDDVEELMRQARIAELEELAKEIPNARTRVDVGVGRGFIEIIQRVQQHGHDLVISPPDQPGGLVGLSRAATTMHLLRKSPVPVWVVRPEVPSSGDVLAAVGPFEEGDPTDLDRKLVEMASSLALQRRGRFHLVHGWGLEGESLLRHGRVKMPSADVDQLVREAEHMATSAVDKLLADVGIDRQDVDVHLVKGRPIDVITRTAEKVDAGVVVLGTLARSGVAGLLMGNTAESTLGTLQSSVLAVKPDGFQSPVEPARSLLAIDATGP